MNRWTTVGEAFAYEKGYIEGRADVSKALEQSGCEDAVSRKAALDALEYMSANYGFDGHREWHPHIDASKHVIKGLPPAQPGWIPVTERLPKPNEYENNVRKYYLVQNEHGDMMVCSWHGGFWMQMYRNTHVEDKVVAWMPLPTPYREGGQP